VSTHSLRRALVIFRRFRDLVAALEALVNCLKDLVVIQRELGPALDRVEALELSRHHFEAEIEGKLLQADGKLKAAKNAEARERQLKRSYESHLLDPVDSDRQEVTEEGGVLPLHASPGEAEGVPAMHMGLASNDKAYALRAKWGR